MKWLKILEKICEIIVFWRYWVLDNIDYNYWERGNKFERIFMMWYRKEEFKKNLIDFLNWGDVVENLGKLR